MSAAPRIAPLLRHALSDAVVREKRAYPRVGPGCLVMAEAKTRRFAAVRPAHGRRKACTARP